MTEHPLPTQREELRSDAAPLASEQAPPFVSVIIPVHNDLERLTVCLEALRRQTYPHDRFEVIVVDNGSTPPITLQDAPQQVRLVREEKLGSYAARNKGLSVARGTVLAFTDADCMPAPQWIEKGVSRLLSVPGCGMVAGQIDLVAEQPGRPTACERYDQLFYLDQKVAINRGHYGATANLFTLRSVVEDVGPFNDDLKSSGDYEWGKRVFAKGYAQAYDEEAQVKHPARNSLRALYRKTVRITGGLHDFRNADPNGPPPLRAFIQELKMWKPPARHVAGILFGRTGKKLGGVKRRVQVASLALLLHYGRRLEFLRLALGGRSRNC